MKKFQHFSPYNGLQWEPNGSRSVWFPLKSIIWRKIQLSQLKKERHGHLG